MFSEALRILDVNTAQYMVEKLHEEVRETKKELQKRDTELLDILFLFRYIIFRKCITE